MYIRFVENVTTREAKPKHFESGRVYGNLSDASCRHWINLGSAIEVQADGSAMPSGPILVPWDASSGIATVPGVGGSTVHATGNMTVLGPGGGASIHGAGGQMVTIPGAGTVGIVSIEGPHDTTIYGAVGAMTVKASGQPGIIVGAGGLHTIEGAEGGQAVQAAASAPAAVGGATTHGAEIVATLPGGADGTRSVAGASGTRIGSAVRGPAIADGQKPATPAKPAA